MPEGTFGGDSIGITGRVVGGTRGGNCLLQACFSRFTITCSTMTGHLFDITFVALILTYQSISTGNY